MTDQLIGKRIGGYEIISQIGQGGMATVYRARQVSMNRDVAIKVLPNQFLNDDTYLQRFNREVRIVSKLEHRNIVPVYDYGEFEGQPYIVMRLMNAGSVNDLLNHGPIPADHVSQIIDQIAPSLDYAHVRNVLHRDLKPSNILLDDDGGAYLTDFGIARILGEQGVPEITTQNVVGTPSYMSPEQAQGLSLDHRSDIYALGISLFEMLTGRRPFEAETPYGVAVLQVTAEPPPPRSINPAIPPAVEQVVFKAMRKNRAERYNNAHDLAEALRTAITAPIHDTQPGSYIAPAPVTWTPPPQPAPPQNYAPPTPSRGTPPAPVEMYTMPPRPQSPPRRSGDLLMNAALGAIIGLGLLAALLVGGVLLLINFQSNDGGSGDDVPDVVSTVGDEVAVSEEVPTESGRPTLLPTPGGISPVGERPADVANGGVIFYSDRDGDFELYRINLETSQETQITSNTFADTYPVASPDGTMLAYQADADGDFDIYVSDVNGGGPRRLTDNSVNDRLPAWSPDGQWLVFSSDIYGDGMHQIFRVRPDGTALEQITLPEPYSTQRNSHVRWSSDGRYLVFTTGQGNAAPTWDIARYDFQTSETQNLTANNSKDWSPNFSPDSASILYLVVGQGNAAIARMNLDGSSWQVVYDGAGSEWGASYSPDGQYIVFNSNETGRDELYLMTSDGQNVQQLTSGGGMFPAWIPVN